MAVVFLAAGHDVALCPEVRRVARMLEGEPCALAPQMRHWPARLLADCAELGAESPARGVMIAAGPNADRGAAAVLATRFARTGAAGIVFTGHLAEGTPAPELVARGAAEFLRWNVHPNRAGLRALLDAVAPRLALAAFVPARGRAGLGASLSFPAFANEGRLEW